MTRKTTACSIGAVVFFGLVVTGCGNAKTEVQQQVPQPPVAANPSPATSTAPPSGLESVPRVDALALRGRIDRDEVRVIDVRDVDAYAAAHIPGALQIPLSYIEGEVPYLRGAKPIVTYCT